MKTARDGHYREVTHTYGLACALIWGGVVLTSIHLFAGSVRLAELMIGMSATQLLSQSENLSHKILYLLLFILLIRWLLRMNRLCLGRIIEIHQYRTRIFDPAVLAREISQALPREIQTGK